MKIAFIATHFGRKEEMSFGPNPLIYNIIKGIGEKEEVVVLSGGFPKKPHEEIIDGVKVLRVFSNYPQFLGKGPYLNLGILGFEKIMREKPDKINSQDFDAALLFKLLNAIGEKIPKSTAIKSITKARVEKTPKHVKLNIRDRVMLASQQIFEKICIRNSDSLIVQSKYAKLELEKFYNPNAEVRLIYNGIDCKSFKPLKLEKELNVLFAGGTDASRKGADVFFKILSELKKQFPELKATIIGAKNLGIFEKFFSKEEIRDFEFIERAPYTKMPFLLNKASIVIVPSYHETFGSIAVEAMACGRTVVASDSTSLPEIIGKAGVLAKTGSVKDFEEKIKYLLENPSMRKKIGKKARERVLEKFTLEKTIKEYLKFFRENK